LLKAFQLPRSREWLYPGERGDRNQLTTRRSNLDVHQRVGRLPILIGQLRDDLIRPIEIVESIDVAAAQEHSQFLRDCGQVKFEIGHAFAIDDDLCLGQVDLEVHVDKHELV
jgi:hypothetical protein